MQPYNNDIRSLRSVALPTATACPYIITTWGIGSRASSPLTIHHFWSKRAFSIGNESQTKDQDHAYEENIKEKILESSLTFVHKRGWSSSAISDGAIALGYPGIIHGMFPNPNAELINYYNKKCNKELNESMKLILQSGESRPIDTQKFIQQALQTRLRMIIPYIDKWAQALAIMSLPTNVPIALQTFSSMIDDVCYMSGDKSVDFNWYSRRGAVAVIYKTTELCMIQDRSVDYVDTWKFLDRRLTEAFTVNKIVESSGDFSSKLKEVGMATLTTLTNLIPLPLVLAPGAKST